MSDNRTFSLGPEDGRTLPLDSGNHAEAIPYLESAVKGLEANGFTADLAADAGRMLTRARRG